MKLLLRVLRHSGHLWPYYVAIAVLSTIIGLLSLATPFLTKQATDIIVSNTGFDAAVGHIIWITISIFGVTAVVALTTNIAGYLGDVMNKKLHKHMLESYYAHILLLPQSYFDNAGTGKSIGQIFRASGGIVEFFIYFSNYLLKTVTTSIIGIIVLAQYSLILAVICAAIYPLVFYLTSLTSRKWQAKQKIINRQYDGIFSRFGEVFSQMKIVKSFGTQDREYTFLSKSFNTVVKKSREQSKYWHSMDFWRQAVFNTLVTAAIGYVFILTLQKTITIGDMVMLTQIIAMIAAPIFSMSHVVGAIQRAIADSRDYFAVLDEEISIKDRPNAKELHVKKAAISYQKVSFAYKGNGVVLSDISFEVPSGKKIALVSESGQGKTTLTNLLLRFYDISSGKILIDGQDISRVTQKSLREHIAVVFQEPALFSGTIRENIAYACSHVTEKELIAAAKSANALEFIEKLEDGFDTKIGERGVKLSGGQKQRLAIARAILKDAPILVLDEATSALDNKSEYLVQAALDHLMKNRTTIIIAHRLSTIAGVDTIVTLKNGTIDEIGTPRDLAQTGGIYSELLKFADQHSEKSKKSLKQFGISS